MAAAAFWNVETLADNLPELQERLLREHIGHVPAGVVDELLLKTIHNADPLPVWLLQAHEALVNNDPERLLPVLATACTEADIDRIFQVASHHPPPDDASDERWRTQLFFHPGRFAAQISVCQQPPPMNIEHVRGASVHVDQKRLPLPVLIAALLRNHVRTQHTDESPLEQALELHERWGDLLGTLLDTWLDDELNLIFNIHAHLLGTRNVNQQRNNESKIRDWYRTFGCNYRGLLLTRVKPEVALARAREVARAMTSEHDRSDIIQQARDMFCNTNGCLRAERLEDWMGSRAAGTMVLRDTLRLLTDDLLPTLRGTYYQTKADVIEGNISDELLAQSFNPDIANDEDLPALQKVLPHIIRLSLAGDRLCQLARLHVDASAALEQMADMYVPPTPPTTIPTTNHINPELEAIVDARLQRLQDTFVRSEQVSHAIRHNTELEHTEAQMHEIFAQPVLFEYFESLTYKLSEMYAGCVSKMSGQVRGSSGGINPAIAFEFVPDIFGAKAAVMLIASPIILAMKVRSATQTVSFVHLASDADEFAKLARLTACLVLQDGRKRRQIMLELANDEGAHEVRRKLKRVVLALTSARSRTIVRAMAARDANVLVDAIFDGELSHDTVEHLRRMPDARPLAGKLAALLVQHTVLEADAEEAAHNRRMVWRSVRDSVRHGGKLTEVGRALKKNVSLKVVADLLV